MATFTTIAELKKMALPELKRERADLARQAAKMRLGIEMQKEKNHALFRRLKRQIARIETVMTLLSSGTVLKKEEKDGTLPAPEKKMTTSTKKTKSAKNTKESSTPSS